MFFRAHSQLQGIQSFKQQSEYEIKEPGDVQYSEAEPRYCNYVADLQAINQ